MAQTRRVSFDCDEESWNKMRIIARTKNINRTLLVNCLLKAFARVHTSDTIEATLMQEIQDTFYRQALERVGRA